MKYRISKYHPLFSKYVDDWTSLTDIGDKRYNLTLEIYFQYEDMYSDILPHLKRRGLPLAKASSRFSFDSTNVLSISELTPCVPRFFYFELC